jgi:hypothetical protein
MYLRSSESDEECFDVVDESEDKIDDFDENEDEENDDDKIKAKNTNEAEESSSDLDNSDVETLIENERPDILSKLRFNVIGSIKSILFKIRKFVNKINRSNPLFLYVVKKKEQFKIDVN